MVQELTTGTVKGVNQVKLDLGTLQGGVYSIQIMNEQTISQQVKIVKQ
jgi:hypothetical protein